jgi:hypothetical protein
MSLPRSRHLALLCLPLLVLLGCSSKETPAGLDTTSSTSINAAIFDPSTGAVPLPNILATAVAADPLTGAYTDHLTGNTVAGARPAGVSMQPPEALAYINKYEMGGTNAVAGLNAPIYIQFSYPVDPATVVPANIKVFQLSADTTDSSSFENNPLGFADVSGLFSYRYAPGTKDLFLFPEFPLLPGTRYLYVVTNRVKDAATGAPIIPSVYFGALKSTAPLTGTYAPLEAIRANATSGGNILLSGYAKVMDDLITASATTTVASRNDIAVMGRFITTGAGFILPNPATPTYRIPVESALRQFAAGTNLPGGLTGKTWDNTVTIPANNPPTSISVFVKGTALSPDLYWQAVMGSGTATAPSSVGAVVLGSFNSADLLVDPVVVAAHAGTMDLTGISGAYNSADPSAGVTQAFRSSGVLTGFYHVARTIHFVYIAPDSPAPAGGYPLVIYQHGITRQKEDVIVLAQALTAAGRAVLAIDLPLHQQNAISGHTTGDAWGQDFMALGAPLATRTNIQQGALNLDRAEFIVLGGNLEAALTGAGIAAKAPDRTTVKPRIVGHSLGSIVAAYYLAGNTTLVPSATPYSQATLDTDMKGFLSSPGGRTAYIIQNSPSFGPGVIAGLALAGINQGTPKFHQFFQVTQTVVDTVDPASMTTPLLATLPSRLSGRIAMQEATTTAFSGVGIDLLPVPTNGDQTIPNPYLRYFANALGGREVLPGGVGNLVAPGFKQLAYLGGGTPAHAAGVAASFMRTTGGAFKVANAAGTAAAGGPGEGLFQFDQPAISHGFLIDYTQATNIGLAQKQMMYFLGAASGQFGVVGTALVVDPTQQAPGLPVVQQPYSVELKVPQTWKILGH